MKLRRLCYLLSITLIVLACNSQNEIIVQSPNGQKKLTVFPTSETTESGQITFSVKYGDRQIILPSVLEIKSQDIDFSTPFSVKNVAEIAVQNQWTTNLGERSTILDNYNEAKIYLESETAKLNLICRAYNEGVAFAYEVPAQNNLTEIKIDDELITYQFAENHEVWSTPERKPRRLTAQGEIKKIPLSELKEGCERPLLVEVADNVKIALAEARLVDYARLSFDAGKQLENSIVSSLDGKIIDTKQDLVSGAVENERSEGAKVEMKLPFKSPWRVVMMGESYGELLENNYILQNLNPPSEIEDESWITPGKVLREGTLTTQGGFAAIDFVASHNMQYVHFDAGWYGNEMDNASDATTVTLDPKRSKGPFDIEAITAYAKEKGVKVMLYVNRRALEKQLDDILPLFQEWGIAGIKYGFVRVGDQHATTWMHEAVKKTAAHKMVIDIHDEYRPTGFSRTYPNLLTQEGIVAMKNPYQTATR
ncbi:glycoside hydrolase family 97 N-terminal domain-containing protein [uncultured Draconibacterium sp.]|uniref:glycoside hydrolase family 97 N-terminal domain-containing protein n=1 Tax=uncultured Draconibacterium sp. TaxID=1573823 RepID=UPI0029C7ADBF|nr:glycoside hydrolase family 97 N-terminal domain-containing protein [uncultured Draconibacterium sp.]